MTGQAWETDEAARPKARNGFAITVTGTRAVTLHLRRMGINPRRRAFGRVKTDGRLRLRLVGHGQRQTVVVPPGEHRLKLLPSPESSRCQVRTNHCALGVVAGA